MSNDLISRDALLDSYDVRNVTEYDETGCGIDYEAVPVEAIKVAPAVDAEPVRHGRWVDNGLPNSMLSKCSECGMLHGAFTFNYCPHCGAKMDGKDGRADNGE